MLFFISVATESCSNTSKRFSQVLKDKSDTAKKWIRSGDDYFDEYGTDSTKMCWSNKCHKAHYSTCETDEPIRHTIEMYACDLYLQRVRRCIQISGLNSTQPLTKKKFPPMSSHVMNICTKFHSNPSTHWWDMSCGIGVHTWCMPGRTTDRQWPFMMLSH